MAVFTPTRFSGPALLTTSVATQFTVGSGKKNVLKQIILNNTSVSPVSVTVHVVPSAGTAGASNAIVSSLVIGPTSQIIWSADIPMNAGETLQAVASTASVMTMTTTGIEIS